MADISILLEGNYDTGRLCVRHKLTPLLKVEARICTQTKDKDLLMKDRSHIPLQNPKNVTSFFWMKQNLKTTPLGKNQQNERGSSEKPEFFGKKFSLSDSSDRL